MVEWSLTANAPLRKAGDRYATCRTRTELTLDRRSWYHSRQSGEAIWELPVKLKEEGIADAVGLAAGDVEVMIPILRAWDFDAVICHNRFMLTNRNAEPMMEFLSDNGVTYLNAAPYAGGLLAKGTEACEIYVYQDVNEDVLAPIRRFEELCARHGIPLGAAALQFSMRDPRVASTICSISKPERVQETLEWAAWPITDEAWQELLARPYSIEDPEASRVQVLE